MPHREEHAPHVGGEHQLEGLDRIVDERIGVAAVDAGAVDGNVETAAVVGGAAGCDLDGVADGVLVVNVGDHVLRLAACVGDELDGLLQRGDGTPGDGDRVAFASERDGGGAADTGPSASDESGLDGVVCLSAHQVKVSICPAG